MPGIRLSMLVDQATNFSAIYILHKSFDCTIHIIAVDADVASSSSTVIERPRRLHHSGSLS